MKTTKIQVEHIEITIAKTQFQGQSLLSIIDASETIPIGCFQGYFRNEEEIRRAVTTYIKDGENLLDQVILSPNIIDKWNQLAQQAICNSKPESIAADYIGTEWAEIDGNDLIVKCRFGQATIQMRVPQGHWKRIGKGH